MSSRGRQAALAVALAALLVLAGCTGGAGGDGAEPAGGDDSADTAADAEQTVTEGDGGGSAGGDASESLAQQDRMRIRTGEVRVEVESFQSAHDDVTAAATDLGGYVSDSTQQRHRAGNRTWTTGTVVLRVPKEEFPTLLERAKALGTVEEVSTDTKDVTGRVVDIQARLDNLRAQRDRLRTLYEEANDTEDVLEVGERLSEVQSEIERLEGELQVLENRVAYSTLTVDLAEPRPDAPESQHEEPAWYETSVVAAFLDSVGGVATTLRATVVALAYAAPYALVFGAPVAVGYVAVRRFGGRGGPRRGGGPDE